MRENIKYFSKNLFYGALLFRSKLSKEPNDIICRCRQKAQQMICFMRVAQR